MGEIVSPSIAAKAKVFLAAEMLIALAW